MTKLLTDPEVFKSRAHGMLGLKENSLLADEKDEENLKGGDKRSASRAPNPRATPKNIISALLGRSHG
jgi:hypothetical protein